MALVKKSDVVALYFEKKGIDGTDSIPEVLKLRWHGDEFHLRPGKSEILPREGAQHIINHLKNTLQTSNVYKNPTKTANVVLKIKELTVKEEEDEKPAAQPGRNDPFKR